MSKKYLFLGLLIVSFLVAPLLLRAETTTDDIARQITSLRQQIAELQRQLMQLQGQKTGQSCYNFEKSFGVGSSGKQVDALHAVLVKEGFSISPLPVPLTATMSDDEKEKEKSKVIYTEATAAAVSAFQQKYAGEILTPNGLTSPTVYVGPATRAKLNQLYGCGRVIPPVPGNLPPTISGVSGPTSLNVGQTATWTINASDPENGTLSYSVIWGDEAITSSTAGSPAGSMMVQQTATFTHSYATVGTYYPTFTVRDNSGQSARTSLSVVVGQNQLSPITVLTPNGGEQWVANSVHPITWRYDGATSVTKVDLWLQRSSSCISGQAPCAQIYYSPIVLDRNIPALSTYNWIVATDIINNPIPPGNYVALVCPAGDVSNTMIGLAPNLSHCDLSDNYFTILPVTP